jgi:hypothetical protein
VEARYQTPALTDAQRGKTKSALEFLIIFLPTNKKITF